MKIHEIHFGAREHNEPAFSFEFFPPKTDEGTKTLFETIHALRTLNPAYVSVTSGAGGSIRHLTIDLVKRLRRETDLEILAHVTSVGSSREEIAAVLDELVATGVQNILALRGDPPRGQAGFQPHPQGFRWASELVAFVRAQPKRWPVSIGVAGYPEGHIETPDRDLDLRHLAAKVEAGADFVLTQLFFDNEHYFTFVKRARACGIRVPVIPGLMPITRVEQIARFTTLCGASIPPRLEAELEARREDPEASRELGVAYAALQCADLLRQGAPGIHFYTLNRSPATRAILSALRAQQPWQSRVQL